jgi:type I restriction enzyme S subunit
VEVIADQQYQEIGIYCFGRGVFHKMPRSGLEVGDKNLYELHAGDLILQVTFAWEGAIALCSIKENGLYGSTRYPTFRIDEERCFPPFLLRYLCTRDGLEQINKICPGSAGRNRVLSIKRIPGVTVPLPSLEEQRRIMARVESLAAKIGEARGLRQQAVQDEERLLVCMAHREDLSTNEKLRSGWFETTVGSICRFTDESESVDGSRSYPNLGIFSYGRGVFPKPSIEGVATSAKTLRRVRAGQFIYSRLFAFEGAYAMVPPELDGHYVSGEYPTFTCDPKKACAEFLWAHFRSPSVWQTVAAGSKGLGNRRQRVQPGRILEYRLWVPPMEWQSKIQSVQAKVDALKKLQAETAAELAALLPSILDKAFKGEL